MADRFDEMARDLVNDIDADWTWDCQTSSTRPMKEAADALATALRELAAAEREAGAADMRESTAEEIAALRERATRAEAKVDLLDHKLREMRGDEPGRMPLQAATNMDIEI